MATNSKNVMVGRIHALWCGHCKSLVPEWSKMKKALSKQRGGYKFVSVEQSKEEPHLERLNKYLKIDDDAKKVQIQGGYPTIFKASNGVVEYYNGPRMADNLVKWAREPMKGGSYKATKSHNKSRSNKSQKALRNQKSTAKTRRRHHQ
jgi:thiol-disulfide isomerase/thioredoxin